MGVKPSGKSDRRWVHRDFERWCFRIVTAVVITVLSSGRSDKVVEDEKGKECFRGVKLEIGFLMRNERDGIVGEVRSFFVFEFDGIEKGDWYREGGLSDVLLFWTHFNVHFD